MTECDDRFSVWFDLTFGSLAIVPAAQEFMRHVGVGHMWLCLERSSPGIRELFQRHAGHPGGVVPWAKQRSFGHTVRSNA